MAHGMYVSVAKLLLSTRRDVRHFLSWRNAVTIFGISDCVRPLGKVTAADGSVPSRPGTDQRSETDLGGPFLQVLLHRRRALWRRPAGKEPEKSGGASAATATSGRSQNGTGLVTSAKRSDRRRVKGIRIRKRPRAPAAVVVAGIDREPLKAVGRDDGFVQVALHDLAGNMPRPRVSLQRHHLRGV